MELPIVFFIVFVLFGSGFADHEFSQVNDDANTPAEIEDSDALIGELFRQADEKIARIYAKMFLDISKDERFSPIPYIRQAAAKISGGLTNKILTLENYTSQNWFKKYLEPMDQTIYILKFIRRNMTSTDPEMRDAVNRMIVFIQLMKEVDITENFSADPQISNTTTTTT